MPSSPNRVRVEIRTDIADALRAWAERTQESTSEAASLLIDAALRLLDPQTERDIHEGQDYEHITKLRALIRTLEWSTAEANSLAHKSHRQQLETVEQQIMLMQQVGTKARHTIEQLRAATSS